MMLALDDEEREPVVDLLSSTSALVGSLRSCWCWPSGLSSPFTDGLRCDGERERVSSFAAGRARGLPPSPGLRLWVDPDRRLAVPPLPR